MNALRDEEEAEKILEWLKREINDAWEKRNEIKPRYEGLPKPKLLEILRLLPKTNCRACGQPTCMVFAALAAQGVKNEEDCPALNEEKKGFLKTYLSRFEFYV